MIKKYVTKIFVIESISRTKFDVRSCVSFSPTSKSMKGLGCRVLVPSRFKWKALLFMSIVYIVQFIDFPCKVFLCSSK